MSGINNSATPYAILGNQNSQGHRIPRLDMEGTWKGDRMIFLSMLGD